MKPYIKRTLELSEDKHSQHTPFKLCDKIWDKLEEQTHLNNKKILVVANLEFLYTLSLRISDMSSVYFATPCNLKQKVATKCILLENTFLCTGVLDNERLQNMKFDVVVGNPPYQDATSTNTKNLWPKFVSTTFNDLCVDGGYVALITPRTWTTNATYDKIFTCRQPIFINIDECARYFPGVGSTFSWYVIHNTKPSLQSFDVVTADGKHTTLTDWPSIGLGVSSAAALNVIMKTQSHDCFVPYTSYQYHTDKFTKSDVTMSKIKTEQHNIPILHKQSAKGTDTIFYAAKNDTKQIHIPRVVFSLWVGRWHDMFVTDTIQTCQQFIQIATTSIMEATHLKMVLCSKLYKFIMLSTVSGGSLTLRSTANFPVVDLSHSWTDQELYTHFNLNDEEIKTIEETVK